MWCVVAFVIVRDKERASEAGDEELILITTGYDTDNQMLCCVFTSQYQEALTCEAMMHVASPAAQEM